MDGYQLARLEPGEAEEIYAEPQVRHVAELEDGNTFIAFDGDIPYDGGTVFAIEGVEGFFPWLPKIRRLAPVPGETEYLALYPAEVFEFLAPVRGMQAALVGCDLVLVLTPNWPAGTPIWTSHSERIWDKRLEGVTVIR